MTDPVAKVILVVDDNLDVRGSLTVLLQLFGFSVETASDGQTALDYLDAHDPPSLILLDLRMPGMNGIQFLNVRRGHPVFSRIPVIVCSGEPEWMVSELLDDAVYFPKASDPLRLIQVVLALCA